MKKSVLSDRQIDRYVLEGYYSEGKRQSWLKAIELGTITHLDTEIRQGKLGQEAQQALKNRTKHPILKQLGL